MLNFKTQNSVLLQKIVPLPPNNVYYNNNLIKDYLELESL